MSITTGRGKNNKLVILKSISESHEMSKNEEQVAQSGHLFRHYIHNNVHHVQVQETILRISDKPPFYLVYLSSKQLLSIYYQMLKQCRTSKCPYIVSSGLAFYYNKLCVKKN